MLSSKLKQESSVFEKYESHARFYSNIFPKVFQTGDGVWLEDTEGGRYLDFLSGAGSLNYGHNNPRIMKPVLEYMAAGGIVHSLDMHTKAKEDFITVFQNTILKPRGYSYKLQFPGPTGTNAVEASLKLARKVTGRTNVVAFTNGFHGMSLGALAATANSSKRDGAGQPLSGTTFMPFDGYLPKNIDSMDILYSMVGKDGSGIDLPAAFIVETVQGEGGLNVASPMWLRRLSQLAKDIGALLIVDDIQAGNGRTGTFFSFEESGIDPDIVLLSKSLSGFGTPFSLLLIRPDYDIWKAGEHNGTFRGNNLAFIGATASILQYWSDLKFQEEIVHKSRLLEARVQMMLSKKTSAKAYFKGRGLFAGIEFKEDGLAEKISRELFQKEMIIETCGSKDQVLKFLPPLTITDSELAEGLDRLEETLGEMEFQMDRAG